MGIKNVLELKISRIAYFNIRQTLENQGLLDKYVVRQLEHPEMLNFGDVILSIDKDFNDYQYAVKLTEEYEKSFEKLENLEQTDSDRH